MLCIFLKPIFHFLTRILTHFMDHPTAINTVFPWEWRISMKEMNISLRMAISDFTEIFLEMTIANGLPQWPSYRDHNAHDHSHTQALEDLVTELRSY